MLSNLQKQPADRIIGLSALYRADPRPEKIDLGVGVYKDAQGNTPIMRAIKKAEKQLWNEETTKTYTALIGDGGFHTVMHELILGDTVDRDRVSYCATPGGTGAIHHVLELVKMTGTGGTVWFSDPTWGNHLTIAKHVGVPVGKYGYFDAETCAVDFDKMMADLNGIAQNDVVVLHGCCHNPTGANLTKDQWDQVADLIVAKGAIPFIDIAYQGFGDGLIEDTYGPRLMAARAPQMLIAASCSKNFGIYRERTGLILAISPDAETNAITQGNLSYVNRQNFSFPPDHGARLVTMVLSDPELRADWMAELEEVRLGMLSARKKLAEALRKASNSDRFDFIADHRGMFSRLGLTEAQVDRLREEHAIYMVFDSRLNIAGVTEDKIETIANAVVSVIRT
ncbi:aromatic amino acid aminotransferase [Amylibacter marinus]|uniref:Aromatic amino acid aminotransferase n=1 Tax=Amylibacter marinus TaxID=1475483 RepID=A0ABQ5VWP0_9RHOB|nr:amino acid aminotransferase [Amylibacter marinus]GLQ35724.1 aromatic amino acid aminotransferase [Amylibacter marinus]